MCDVDACVTCEILDDLVAVPEIVPLDYEVALFVPKYKGRRVLYEITDFGTSLS
jgi:hypothetical protein